MLHCDVFEADIGKSRMDFGESICILSHIHTNNKKPRQATVVQQIYPLLGVYPVSLIIKWTSKQVKKQGLKSSTCSNSVAYA